VSEPEAIADDDRGIDSVDRAELRAMLSAFTGTTAYHAHWSGMRYTDGVQFLVEHARAYWLLDLIASWQLETLRDAWLREFQLWELFVRPDGTATAVCSRDSEDVAFRQEVAWTDFPLEYVKLYVENGIVSLPSEH
jgi:hypothetical protein